MESRRILFVAPYFPLPLRSGGTVRVYSVLRELAQRHGVTLVCPSDPSHAPYHQALKELGVRLRVVMRPFGRRPLRRHLRYLPSRIPFSMVNVDHEFRELVREEWRTRPYDLIQVEFLAMSYAAEDREFDGRRFLTLHFSATNSLNRLKPLLKNPARRVYAAIDAWKMPAYERSAARSSIVFVTSEYDADAIQRLSGGVKPVVASNGVDAEFYAPEGGEGGRERLVISTYNFQTPSNVDGVRYFLEQVWPFVHARDPQLRYEILGREPPAELFALARNRPNVTVIGEVDDVRPYFRRALSSLVIMRAGSGTKIRAFTSLAMGVPVVATSLGAEGIDATPADGLFVADSPIGLADTIVDVTRSWNPDAAHRARQLVLAKHTWEACVRQMEVAYEEHTPRDKGRG